MKFAFVLIPLHLILSLSFTPAFAGDTVKLDTPPASLEQWYKPANKRQVWLHTMFRLRREMQAISEHANLDNKPAIKNMQKWISRLDKDYNKIADMVPEWEQEVKPRLLSELKMFAKKGDAVRVNKTLKMIKRTCDDCHKRYQPLVIATYRSPGYDDIKIKKSDGSSQSFKDNMDALSKSVNRILIALDDGKKPMALQASQKLKKQLHNLGSSCTSCHKKDAYPKERILGKPTIKMLSSLETKLNKWHVKDSQELMGKFAVTVCARCHNTHRIVSDLRNALLPAK